MSQENIIKNATIKAINSNSNATGYTVTLNNGEEYALSKKAMWSWGRFQVGKTSFDEQVKAVKSGFIDSGLSKKMASRKASATVFKEAFEKTPDSIPMQAIFKDVDRQGQYATSDKAIYSFASMNHSLVDPEPIRQMALRVFGEQNITINDRHRNIFGKDWLLGKYGTDEGMDLGINFDAGDIITKNAIVIGQFIELQVCTNPLVWAKDIFRNILPHHQSAIGDRVRILRVNTPDTFAEKRIIGAIKYLRSNDKGLIGMLRASHFKMLTVDQVRVIVKELFGSYGLAVRTIEEVLEEFNESNGRSVFDLSMAISQIAQTGTFKKEGTHMPARLSAIAAVLTQVESSDQLYNACVKRQSERQRVEAIEARPITS